MDETKPTRLTVEGWAWPRELPRDEDRVDASGRIVLTEAERGLMHALGLDTPVSGALGPYASSYEAFDFGAGVFFPRETEGGCRLGKFIEDGTDPNKIVIWALRKDLSLAHDPIKDMKKQRDELVTLARGTLDSDTRLPSALTTLLGSVTGDIVAMARINGLDRFGVAILLRGPVEPFKYNHTLLLYSLAAYEVFLTRQWISCVKPYPRVALGSDDARKYIPCMLHFTAGMCGETCAHQMSHDPEHLANLKMMRKRTVQIAREKGEPVAEVLACLAAEERQRARRGVRQWKVEPEGTTPK